MDGHVGLAAIVLGAFVVTFILVILLKKMERDDK